jgi:crotonobetainyl-CoA:carnitine CoA-transferase CaiB-like acyl-CoA transferase
MTAEPLNGVRVVKMTMFQQGPVAGMRSASFQRNPPHNGAAKPPTFGQHSEGILSEIGYSKDDIARLKEKDVIR